MESDNIPGKSKTGLEKFYGKSDYDIIPQAAFLQHGFF